MCKERIYPQLYLIFFHFPNLFAISFIFTPHFGPAGRPAREDLAMPLFKNSICIHTLSYAKMCMYHVLYTMFLLKMVRFCFACFFFEKHTQKVHFIIILVTDLKSTVKRQNKMLKIFARIITRLVIN